MATSSFRRRLLLICSVLVLFLSSSIAATSFRPKALVLPVTKDASTKQHVTHLRQRTPLVPLKLTLDLGGKFLWVDCAKAYVSSTYRPVRCRSAQCSLTGSKACGDCFDGPKPGCNNNTCSTIPVNSVIGLSTSGEVAQDVVAVQSTNGFNPRKVVTVSKFIFTCGSTFLLEGLASRVKGIAGLGRSSVSLPSQFASAFSFKRKFAICLTSAASSNGVVFFGDGPYSILPGIDFSKSLTFTPLIKNPVSTVTSFAGEPSSEYFIGVNSILINEKPIKINTTLLTIDREGKGGTKISTVNPYTVLERSIYTTFVKAFGRALAKVPRATPVSPFELCFKSASLGATRVGPGVPNVDLVLQNKGAVWRMFGSNSMVEVSDEVSCLGFVDGGVEPRTSIVIGAHQIEDNLLQFDLAASRLGFTSSLLFARTTCANFNFTSTH